MAERASSWWSSGFVTHWSSPIAFTSFPEEQSCSLAPRPKLPDESKRSSARIWTRRRCNEDSWIAPGSVPFPKSGVSGSSLPEPATCRTAPGDAFKASNGVSPCCSHQPQYKESSTGGKLLPPILKPKVLLVRQQEPAIGVANRMLVVPATQATARGIAKIQFGR